VGVYVTKPSTDGAVPAECQVLSVNKVDLLQLTVSKGLQLLSLIAEAGGSADLVLAFVGVDGFATHEFFVGCGTATLTINVERTEKVQAQVAAFLQSCRGGVMKMEIVEEIEHTPPQPGTDNLSEPPTRLSLTLEDMSILV
jgi:hypothetical protein